MAAELRASPSLRCGKVLQKPCWRAGSGPCPPRTAPACSHASVRGERKGETEAFLASSSPVANKYGRSARGAKARRSPAPRHCPPGPAPVPEPIRSSGALPRHRGPCRFKACDTLPSRDALIQATVLTASYSGVPTAARLCTARAGVRLLLSLNCFSSLSILEAANYLKITSKVSSSRG